MICIPIVAERQSEALQMIQRCAGLADVLELRMDLVSDGNLKELMGAVRSASSGVKILVTNRRVQDSWATDEILATVAPEAKDKSPLSPPLLKGGNKTVSLFAKGVNKIVSPLAREKNIIIPPLTEGGNLRGSLRENKRIPPLAKGGMGGFGGYPSEKERIGVLLEAVSLGADYVDIELETAEAWRKKICAMIASRGSRAALIVSHHDFLRTPSRKTLIGIFNESVQAGASIVKIVTLARAPGDNLTVLGLIPYARRRKKDIIAFCMGEEGKISRVVAPLLGAFFTFASLKRGAESGAGQLTINEMRQIYRILGGSMKISPDPSLPKRGK